MNRRIQKDFKLNLQIPSFCKANIERHYSEEECRQEPSPRTRKPGRKVKRLPKLSSQEPQPKTGALEERKEIEMASPWTEKSGPCQDL